MSVTPIHGRSRGPVTAVPDEDHLRYLLGEVRWNLRNGRQKAAITNLAQAVLVAHTKRTSMTDAEVLEQVQAVNREGGGLA